jgi:hypothetical protein
MSRRPLLSAALVVGVVSLAAAQTPPAPTAVPSPRPESLLPDDTLIYLGTDDLDTTVAKSKASPFGQILAEKEVSDFLAKPIGDFRKMVDLGLAMAKQNPALAGVELDLDKLFAGPYGRAFVAVTGVKLPAAPAFDPATLDLGIVIGLEPKKGASDPLATLKTVLVALAGQEGGPLKVETVQATGFTYDKLQAPGGAPPLCFANAGGLSLFTTSERALTGVLQHVQTPGTSLATSAAFARCVAAAGAPSAGDVVVFAQVGRVMELARNVAELGLDQAKHTVTRTDEQGKVVTTTEPEPRAVMIRKIVEQLFDAGKLTSLGPSYATSTWRDGVCVATAYSESDPSQGGFAALEKNLPIDRDLLKFVPKNALEFSLGSFDVAPLWDMVMNGLKEAAPEIHGQAVGAIRAVETKVAGADAQGEPTWDVRRDLVGAIGGRVMTMKTPSTSSDLFSSGNLVGWIETPNPDALEKSMKYLFAIPGQMFDKPLNLKEQMHGDAKLETLDLGSLGPAALFAASLQPTYTIRQGKMWFSTNLRAIKKALDSQTTPPTENITANPDFSSHFVEPPQGAVVTSLSYSDTAKNFEKTYGALVQAIPMVMPQLQTMGFELPIDTALLPYGETISKHLFGTVSMSYRTGKTGHVTVSRGPIGPETGVWVAAGIGMIAAQAAQQAQQKQMKRAMQTDRAAVSAEPNATPKPAGKGEPADQAKGDLALLSSSVTAFVVEYGKPPATLDELTKPTKEYPKGVLQGAALPVDPWGHAYSYKSESDGKNGWTVTIWSFGPNGVDDHGDGDDVVQKTAQHG